MGTAGLLEADVRLSASRLWQWQRAYYEEAGVSPWRDGVVPFLVTSNRFLARAYAQLVVAWLRDLAAEGRLRRDRPVELVELGGGSGRFAYQLLCCVREALVESPFADMRIRYRFTDLAAATVALVAQHGALAALGAAVGELSVERFDLAHDPFPADRDAAARNPPVVIANYVFDSLPQDVFAVTGGQLSHRLATLQREASEWGEDDSAANLGTTTVSFGAAPIEHAVYDDAICERVLREHERLADGTFTFPCVALSALSALRDALGGRALLLAADKGYHRPEELRGRGDPLLARHGAVSMMVNFWALARWCERDGGTALLTDRASAHVDVVAMALGAGVGDATRAAYRDVVERFGPDEMFTLCRPFEAASDLALSECVAWARLTAWDPSVVIAIGAAMASGLGAASPSQRDEVREGLRISVSAYYCLGEQPDGWACLGYLFYLCEAFDDAVACYEQSLAWYGPGPVTSFYLGMCAMRRDDARTALGYFDASLALAPSFEAPRAMRLRLLTTLAR